MLRWGIAWGQGWGEPRCLGPPDSTRPPQGNYVLGRDELVAAQRPEYDVVLCLSLTKWVHLNWGDEGLKRLFKRTFRHLRPGGVLVLEPQPWSSYGKRKGLTVWRGGHAGIGVGPRKGRVQIQSLTLPPLLPPHPGDNIQKLLPDPAEAGAVPGLPHLI